MLHHRMREIFSFVQKKEGKEVNYHQPLDNPVTSNVVPCGTVILMREAAATLVRVGQHSAIIPLR